MGLGLAGGACAAMRWLCCFKTSGQLVSWWTGGVEVTVTGAVIWCVWMCGGYWLSRVLDRIQAKVWTSVKIWREGGREWSREKVCVFYRKRMLSEGLLTVSNKQWKQVSHCEKKVWAKFQTVSYWTWNDTSIPVKLHLFIYHSCSHYK